MGRRKGDGLGRFGGRAKGTPNKKDAPIKMMLREHTQSYLEPRIVVEDEEMARMFGVEVGAQVSQYALDLAAMEPKDRVNAQLQAMNYHTPKMSATDVDMRVEDNRGWIEEHLARLAEENER